MAYLLGFKFKKMHRLATLIKHFFITLISIVVLFLLIQNIPSLIEKGWLSPEKYGGDKLDEIETLVFSINLMIIVTSVLISYIIYLILSHKTRAELTAFRQTKSLYTSLDQLRNMYEGAPVPYITLDKEGNILDPNKATLRFFDALTEEITGKNIFYYQPKEDLEKADKLLQYYKSNIPINREEVKLVTKDGKVRWSLLSVFKIEGPIRKGRVGLATIFDITEQKELDKAKTEFVSLASHQLRTPTATTKWFLKMLLSGDLGDLSPKQKDYLERIDKVNDTMIDLVETLLNISRIEIGSIVTDIRSVNVAELVENVLFELSTQIEEKQLKITKQYSGELEDIKSDPKLLQIVLNNILSNAVKYTPPNGTITIAFKESLGDKSITVADTGMGIPENEQGKIFNKLFRATNVRKMSESQGTGLGLYLVKSLLQTLGGSIDFVSEENKGSTFTIKL